MSCPGLHCPGCTAGQSAGVFGGAALALAVAYEASGWVAARIWWIAGTAVLSFALSVAASMWLEARSARRGREWGAERGIYSRADLILPAAPPPPPAITPVCIFNFYGTESDPAAVIRKAISG